MNDAARLSNQFPYLSWATTSASKAKSLPVRIYNWHILFKVFVVHIGNNLTSTLCHCPTVLALAGFLTMLNMVVEVFVTQLVQVFYTCTSGCTNCFYICISVRGRTERIWRSTSQCVFRTFCSSEGNAQLFLAFRRQGKWKVKQNHHQFTDFHYHLGHTLN